VTGQITTSALATKARAKVEQSAPQLEELAGAEGEWLQRVEQALHLLDVPTLGCRYVGAGLPSTVGGHRGKEETGRLGEALRGPRLDCAAALREGCGRGLDR
jgi:hypothetical protein